MKHRIYTIISIYNSARRLNICLFVVVFIEIDVGPKEVIKQSFMMLPRCLASARGVRREGEQTIQCLSTNCFN